MKLLIIFILNIIFLVLFGVGIAHVSITNETYLFAPFLLTYLFTTIILMFSFAKYISSRKIKITNMQFFNFEKEVNVELYAERNGDSFSLRYKGQEIVFETDSKIFKKGMFMAYVVRSIRFPEVSNRLPLLNLFKRKLPLVSSNLHKLTINLDGKKYILVKNGISFNKYSFINKCWYFKDFLFKRSDCYIGRTICNINEALFEKGRMDFTKKK